jgi:PAS domain S-box-containing protein
VRLRGIRHWSIGTKLAATLVAVICGVAFLLSVSIISHQRQALDTELQQRAINLAQSLARLSVDPLLQDDLWRLYTLVRDIVQAEGAVIPAARDRIVRYAMVVAPQGEILAHSDPARFPLGELLAPDPVHRRALEAEEPLIQPVARPGEPLTYDVAVPVVLDRQRLAVARVGVTTAYLEATLARVRRQVLLVVFVLASFGLVLGLVISRRITRPLVQLTVSVEALSRGQLHAPLLVHTVEKDEVGRLADAFNRMAHHLRESMTEMRATRDYLENLLEHAHDFIYTTDLSGTLTYVNGRFRELGWEKAELVGQPLSAVMPDAARNAGTGGPETVEVAVRDREGRVRLWVLTRSPLRDREGCPTGALGIAKDITDRREMEERLRESERLASVGALAAAVAHEIRNPLGALVTAASLLARDGGPTADPERQALLAVVQQESRRVNRILEDFLRLGRTRPPVTAPHDVGRLAEEVLAGLALTETGHGKTVHRAFPAQGPWALVDADQFKQVLWNVCLNALEAVGPGPGAVRVAAHASDGHVRVTVTDTGRGIPREQLRRIFEPFHTTKREGMGLGLTIARRIVEQHRGQITVDSEPERGTTVTITVPAAPPPEAP